MIISINSSIPTFKTMNFRQGLNILLTDTSPGATEKQTRNSAGKTSLIEIIHFLLGADCDKESLFRTDALIKHSFQGTFDIGSERFVVSRSGADPSKVFLLEGGEWRTELPKRVDKATERFF